MSLNTESSMGKECEKQGWWLHGGHTTKGAVYSFILLDKVSFLAVI